MFHDLTPDLVDPMLLAETNLPSLHEVIGLKKGDVTLTVDPTIRKPIRIRSDGFSAYGHTAQRDVEDMVLTLNACFAPFSVGFLKANVRADHSIWPLDLMTSVSTLQLMYLRAQNCIELTGHVVMLDLSVTDADGKLRPSVICAVQGFDGEDRVKLGAMAEYQAAVQALWSRLVQNSLGHWLRDNGVREFRLAGEFLIDPRQAMAAIGQPVPVPTASVA